MAISVEIPFPLIDPALINIPAFEIGTLVIGPLSVRWYALAYLLGALFAYLYLRTLCRHDELFGAKSKPPDQRGLEDLVFNTLLGALIGGRLGYILFYQLVFDPGRLMADPLLVFRLWEGGMSFHGGMIGALVAIIITARSSGTHILTMFDLTAVSVPIALCLGRIANFINGELYGRPTDLPWAVRFPIWNEENRLWVYTGFELPVHPSQLYEAALEGVLLFCVQLFAVWRFRILTKPGLALALFLLLYAMSRIFVENFRSPDARIDFLPGIVTMGMVLSLPMLALGIFLAVRALAGDERRQGK